MLPTDLDDSADITFNTITCRIIVMCDVWIKILTDEKEVVFIRQTKTYTINEISFGHTQYVEAILENGMRVPLSLEDITREKLEQRMKLFPAKISYVQIKDNAPILKEIRIVDTSSSGCNSPS